MPLSLCSFLGDLRGEERAESPALRGEERAESPARRGDDRAESLTLGDPVIEL